MTPMIWPGLHSSHSLPLATGYRLRAPCSPVLQASQLERPCRSRRQLVTRAAASDLPSDDPYKVLGLRSGAEPEAVQRQYNKLKREKRGDDAAISKIESAHSTLMMRQLTARMQGGFEVSKDIKYADKAVYLPYRPMYARADKRLLIFAGIGQAWVIANANNTSSGTLAAKAAWGVMIGMFSNIAKQWQFRPTKSSREMSDEERQKGLKNLARGIGLAIAATVVGYALFTQLPEVIADTLGKRLPAWWYAREVFIKITSICVSNYLVTAFCR